MVCFWVFKGFLNMELPFKIVSLLFTFPRLLVFCVISLTTESRGLPVGSLFLKRIYADQLKIM